MRQVFAAFAVALAVLTFAGIVNAQNVPETPRPGLDLVNRAQQTYIFRLAPETSPAEVQRIARAVAGVGGGRPDHVYTAVMRGFSARLSDAALLDIEEQFPEIVAIQRSNVFSIAKKPLDSPGKGPGSGDGEVEAGGADTVPWGVARVLPQDDNGDAIIQDGTTSSRTLWVLDTGVDLDHGDLNVDTANSVNCVAAFGSRGKDTPDDQNGHGTHVAGTAAAKANGADVVGVAAGATVVSVRVLDRRGSGTTAEVICGIDWVVDRGTAGDVANMSLTGPADTALDDAVFAATEGAGILFSLAAGNNGAHANARSPARANHANIYTVSAVDSGDNFASFSNYGNPPVDFAAPGVGVLSLKHGGGTTTKSGTSMAAPHVAGLLILQGRVECDGTANGDPDGSADDIAHLSGPC